MKPFKTLATGIIAIALTAASSLPAFADTASEIFVEKNANNVLATLNQPTLSDEERTQKFNKYMFEFSDIRRIARFVLGRHGRGLNKDEFSTYFDAFNSYALAVYEAQLDQFRGEEIEVVGSVDLRDDGSDSIVQTQLKSGRTGELMDVEWRVRKKRGTDLYRVLDVALNLDGSQIWLAREQQAQFVSVLDRANGDIDVLVTRINEMTEKLMEEKKSAKQPEAVIDNAAAENTQEAIEEVTTIATESQDNTVAPETTDAL